MRHCSVLVLVMSVFLLVRCAWTMEDAAQKTLHPSAEAELPSRARKGGRREGRFLGLLGLLTGLTLVDSLDDDSDRPRRSGFVKIDVGHPAALDAFYGAYGYASPYWTGGSSINIKIPFRPSGSEFETMALFPYPMHFPQHGPSHFGAGPASIEPRPTIFSDPIPSASNGSTGTTLADDVDQPSARKQKLAPRKGTTTSRRSRPNVSPPRTIRSTLRADGDADDDELNVTTVPVPETTVTIETQEPQEEAIEPSVSNDPAVSPTNTPTNHQAPVSEDPEPATPASIVQSELNYVTQPMIPSSYHTHQHSLADVSVIELTTGAGDFFQPSRADHWQDYYTSVAQNGAKRQPGFLPIADRG